MAIPINQPDTFSSPKEFRVVTFYDQNRQHRLVSVTGKDHRHAGRLMRKGACLLKLRQAVEQAAIVDGALWISAARMNMRRYFVNSESPTAQVLSSDAVNAMVRPWMETGDSGQSHRWAGMGAGPGTGASGDGVE